MDNLIFKNVSLSLKYERLNQMDNYYALLTNLSSLYFIPLDSPLFTVRYRSDVRFVRNYWKRLSRCRQRIDYMLRRWECYFYTFTFTDDVLISTSPATRRKYIQRLLDGSHYVGNVDYGKTTGREHYHAISNVIINDYPYGFFSCFKIRLDYDSFGNCITLSRLSKYVAKLSCHALKDSTRGSRLLYSRHFPGLIDHVDSYLDVLVNTEQLEFLFDENV